MKRSGPKKENWKNLKRFYQLYKSDLSMAEIERLVKRDVPGIYEFYSRDMEKPDQNRNWLFRTLIFIRNFFLTFLLKLTAARRLFYSIAIALFFYGLVVGLINWMFISFLILNILLALEVADKIMAKDELEVAREIQMGLMPASAPADIPCEIACFSEPAREVGGDYYDFIRPRRNGKDTYMVIGDVKGKGMGAALYMVRVQALLQYLAETYQQPAEILVELNKNIRKIMQADYFISLSITRVHSSGNFTLARAGHMPLIYYNAKSRELKELEPSGMAVGLENNGRFEETIEELSLRPGSGDILVYYTDGVVETMDEEQNQFGAPALNKIIQKTIHLSAPEIKEAILKDVARFRSKAAPQDDLSLIVVKVK
ncbi:MAG: serine/threonine-protein phosphatase [bacterium]|nr:MAG: serine/threonine-protein phosphatase [bacterium]